MIHIHYNGKNLQYPLMIKVFIGLLCFILVALLIYGFFVCVLCRVFSEFSAIKNVALEVRARHFSLQLKVYFSKRRIAS
jgi:uncharacterized membrane protein